MRHSWDIMKMLLKVSLSPSSILCYNCSPRFPNLVRLLLLTSRSFLQCPYDLSMKFFWRTRFHSIKNENESFPAFRTSLLCTIVSFKGGLPPLPLPPPPLLKTATFLCFPNKNPKILFALPFQPTYVIINMYDIIDVWKYQRLLTKNKDCLN